MIIVLPNRADIQGVVDDLERQPASPERDAAIAKCRRALAELPDSA